MNGAGTSVLTINSTAKIAEESLRQEIETMFQEGEELEDMKAWGGKLAGQIIRIAGLIHVTQHIQELDCDCPSVDDIPNEINERVYAKARQLVPYFIAHAKTAYGYMGADEKIEDAKYLLKIIKRQQKSVVEYRDIQMATRKRFKKAEHLKSILIYIRRAWFCVPDERKSKDRLCCESFCFRIVESTTLPTTAYKGY